MVYFYEIDTDAIKTLEENISTMELEDGEDVTVVQMDLLGEDFDPKSFPEIVNFSSQNLKIDTI